MSFLSFLQEANNKYEDIVNWINTLDIGSRTPRGMKNEHDILINIKKTIDDIKEFEENKINYEYFDKEAFVDMVIQRAEMLDKEVINKKFRKDEDKPKIISKKYATYIKEDGSSYAKFLNAIDDIEDFLSTLKGFHKIPLKNLRIKFAKKGVLKSKAKYSEREDLILINLQSMGKTSEEYGSLRYVLLHELGHRYLRIKPQRWDIDSSEWITTEYSKVDSFSSEEKFAELFAISHWESKYSKFKDKIYKFKKML